MIALKPLLTVASLTVAVTSFAATSANANDVRFLGTIDPLCTLVVNQGGTMKSSSDGTVLGSKELGGAAAAVVATSNTGLLSFNATAPSGFVSAPTGGDQNVTFVSDYTAAGIGTVLGGTASQLPIGVTALAINLTATKSSGAFPAGDYIADVVVTCE